MRNCSRCARNLHARPFGIELIDKWIITDLWDNLKKVWDNDNLNIFIFLRLYKKADISKFTDENTLNHMVNIFDS